MKEFNIKSFFILNFILDSNSERILIFYFENISSGA